jgi:hypothetical protein
LLSALTASFSWLMDRGLLRRVYLNLMALFLVLFPLLFLPLFAAVINWRIYDRYFIVYIPCLILAGTVAAASIARLVRVRWGTSGLALAFGYSLFALLIAGRIMVLAEGPVGNFSSDYRKVFEVLAAAQPNSIALPVPFQDMGGWRPEGFIASEFYYPDRGPVRFPIEKSLSIERFLTELLTSGAAPKTIYFVSFPEFNQRSLDADDIGRIQHAFPGSKQYPFAGPPRMTDGWIIEVPVSEDAFLVVRRFFALMVEGHAELNSNFHLYALLQLIDHLLGNESGARVWRDRQRGSQ